MKRVLFAPHSDDEALFAFYIVCRFKPDIVICFPSERDYGDTAVRLEESRAAMQLAGVETIAQWAAKNTEDLVSWMRELDRQGQPTEVWAPHANASHVHHQMVAQAATAVFGARVRFYHTYDASGKVRNGYVVPSDPEWSDLKRQALACYETQRTHPRACIFYDERQFGLDEYSDQPVVVELSEPPVEKRARRSRKSGTAGA